MPDVATFRLPQELIRLKRDGATLAPTDLAAFVEGAVSGAVSHEQVAAFLMAAFLRGLDRDETVALTMAMMRSGTVLDWADMPGPVLDKHSTGGVGDNVSLILAPAVAACGGFVPMISGRGLGHSGGTLDKLESIPGYDVRPSPDHFRRVVRDVGCAIVGQTADLAPADRLFYSIRDVTGTVESIPLITASILSKKLAAGLSRLVMDVKVGSGAFMTTLDEAKALAESLVAVAAGAGLPTSALLTDMDQPLASAAGNALEVRSALDHLTGRAREPRLHAVVVALGAEMLRLGGLADTREIATDRIEAALAGGAAAETFARMTAALGGPHDILTTYDRVLPKAEVCRPILAGTTGFVTRIDTRRVGLTVVKLGGGRVRSDDSVDPSVGFSDLLPVGMSVMPDTPLGFIHAKTTRAADDAAASLLHAYEIGPQRPEPSLSIIHRMEAQP